MILPCATFRCVGCQRSIAFAFPRPDETKRPEHALGTLPACECGATSWRCTGPSDEDLMAYSMTTMTVEFE